MLFDHDNYARSKGCCKKAALKVCWCKSAHTYRNQTVVQVDTIRYSGRDDCSQEVYRASIREENDERKQESYRINE
jgi:hypothetical protein